MRTRSSRTWRRPSTDTTKACCSTSTASSPKAPARTFSSSRTASCYEPELTSALIGITRDSVITLAREMGYAVTARRITRDDLYIADEAFFTGTAAEVTPIRELDGRTIGEGKRGPITTRIQQSVLRMRQRKSREASRLAHADRRVEG